MGNWQSFVIIVLIVAMSTVVAQGRKRRRGAEALCCGDFASAPRPPLSSSIATGSDKDEYRRLVNSGLYHRSFEH
jgi:hypothetical protein